MRKALVSLLAGVKSRLFCLLVYPGTARWALTDPLYYVHGWVLNLMSLYNTSRISLGCDSLLVGLYIPWELFDCAVVANP
jgi:hypothetical protein